MPRHDPGCAQKASTCSRAAADAEFPLHRRPSPPPVRRGRKFGLLLPVFSLKFSVFIRVCNLRFQYVRLRRRVCRLLPEFCQFGILRQRRLGRRDCAGESLRSGSATKSSAYSASRSRASARFLKELFRPAICPRISDSLFASIPFSASEAPIPRRHFAERLSTSAAFPSASCSSSSAACSGETSAFASCIAATCGQRGFSSEQTAPERY